MSKPEEQSCERCQHIVSSPFKSLTVKELKCVDHQKVCQPFKKGQILFHEGDKPIGVYCIKQGKIKIYKNGAGGREQVVRLAAPGDLVGYRSFLGGDIYNCTAATLEDSVVCFVERQSFQSVLEENCEFAHNLLGLLTQELREAENMIRDMAQKSVRERLAIALILLKNKFGMDAKEPRYLSAKLSREELASLVGTATETVIRLISEFKEAGILETQGKKIQILQPEILLGIANLVD